MSKGQKFNPSWPSALADTAAAKTERSRKSRARQRERMSIVEGKIGMTVDMLLDGILNDTIVIVKRS